MFLVLALVDQHAAPCVTRLWTIDHMRCSPPMRPAALYHGIGTRGGYAATPRPFGLGNAARVHRPTAPPASRLSSLEADSTAWAGPVRPRAGRCDRTRPTDSADPGRPDRTRSAGPVCRGLPIRPVQVAATGGNCRLGRARARSKRPVAAQGDGRCDRSPPRPDPRPIRPRTPRLPHATAADSARRRPSAKRSQR